MNLIILEELLYYITKKQVAPHDAAHDIHHIERVLAAAKTIQKGEQAGDLEVIIPTVFFHDFVMYPKNDPRSKEAANESAEHAEVALKKIRKFPKKKIPQVVACVQECSWSKSVPGSTLESRIVQDADWLEATGAIAIMRTFTTGGLMGRPFYNSSDPFAKNRTADGLTASLDLFQERLLKVPGRLNTTTGRKLAERRHRFLIKFLEELELELEELNLYPYS